MFEFLRGRSPENPVTEPDETVADEAQVTVIEDVVSFGDYNPAAIHDLLNEQRRPYDLIETRMPLPVGKVQLTGDTSSGSLVLHGSVQLKDKDHAKDTYVALQKHLLDQRVEHGYQTEEYHDAISIAYPDGSRILFGRGTYHADKDAIIVSTGATKKEYDSFKYTNFFEQPADDLESFQKVLPHILGGMALTLNMAFTEASQTTPRKIDVKTPVGVEPSYSRAFGIPRLPDLSREAEPQVEEQAIPKPERVTLDDIGGQAEAKEEIRSLIYAISHPEAYQRWGTKPPKAVLFEGPPGTGKTLLAKALASEADAAFYSVSATDVTSKWFGEAEKRIRDIFEKAAKNERAIIFFDELDGLAPARDNSHEATKRVVSVMLQYMDGMKSSDNVLVIGSTNRKSDIDPAVLRAGRFDRKIEVGLPDNDGRQDIYDIRMNKACKLADRELFDDTVTSQQLAEMSPGMSGADIAEIIRITLEQKVSQETVSGEPAELVSLDDIAVQIKGYKK